MNILVCVKQVIDPGAAIQIGPQDRWPQEQRTAAFCLSRFDEYAVEEAIRIKERLRSAAVDIVSVGPRRVLAAVKRAQGMGADHGIHIAWDAEGYISPFAIAEWIAALASRKAYDLILTGVMSDDAMQGQVGPTLAALLDWPWATSVVRQHITDDGSRVRVERETEAGRRDILELNLPAVLTIQSGINQPRYPKLSSMLRATREEAETYAAQSLGTPDSRQSLVRVAYPRKTRAGEVLQGDCEEKARKLLAILAQKGFIGGG